MALVPVDRERQEQTKRRLRRAQWRRRHRRSGDVLFWGAVALIPLAIAAFYLNHYVFSRGTVSLTVAETRSYVSNREPHYTVHDADGKLYYVEGFHRARVHAGLVEGERYRCKVRGIDQELPLLPDFHAEITSCRGA
jgi:hypothetical protein